MEFAPVASQKREESCSEARVAAISTTLFRCQKAIEKRGIPSLRHRFV